MSEITESKVKAHKHFFPSILKYKMTNAENLSQFKSYKQLR